MVFVLFLRNESSNSTLAPFFNSSNDTSWADDPIASTSGQSKDAEGEHESLQTKLAEEMNPRRHAVHRFFNTVSAFTMFAAFNMGLGQIIGLAYESDGPIQYILRIYVIALSLLVILNELEWSKWTKDSTLLMFWPTRGCIYFFIGVLGLEENDAAPSRSAGMAASAGRATARKYTSVVAYMMIAVGVFYALLGIFCGQIVLNRLRDDYQKRTGQAKETKRVADTYGLSVPGGNLPNAV